uniref:Ribosomal protein S4 n=1 Tax=Entransia fimbriata TaxID=130991 RepID=U5YDZ4_9VIRI|nr:ribosomal protein S4 [Entransia fimbriata]AGZ90309.1 ribosomal protein S4 [Entransia fimbriata]
MLKFKRSRQLKRNIWITKKRTPKQRRILKYIFKRNKFLTKRAVQSVFFLLIQAKRCLSHFYGLSNLHPRGRPWKTKKSDLRKKFLLLETRLDTIVYRMNICSSMYAVKQLINHKKVVVNNRIVNARNFQVRPGDFICVENYSPVFKGAAQGDEFLHHPPAQRREHLIAFRGGPRGATKNGKRNVSYWPYGKNAAPNVKFRRFYIKHRPSHLEINPLICAAVLLKYPERIRIPYIRDLSILQS